MDLNLTNLNLAFAARINVVSGYESFEAAVFSDPAVLELERDTEVRERITMKLGTLLTRKFDERFENPNDATIAALLLILKRREPELASRHADRTLRRGKNLFWARRVAEKILGVI